MQSRYHVRLQEPQDFKFLRKDSLSTCPQVMVSRLSYVCGWLGLSLSILIVGIYIFLTLNHSLQNTLKPLNVLLDCAIINIYLMLAFVGTLKPKSFFKLQQAVRLLLLVQLALSLVRMAGYLG